MINSNFNKAKTSSGKFKVYQDNIQSLDESSNNSSPHGY